MDVVPALWARSCVVKPLVDAFGVETVQARQPPGPFTSTVILQAHLAPQAFIGRSADLYRQRRRNFRWWRTVWRRQRMTARALVGAGS